ncbi:MAG TPA: helix-turn-helix domain-containing protein [Solirubrobacterales bacterium]|nr:helix-turn-helix domain-containing protein [Solirubrobacterales bacterium]
MAITHANGRKSRMAAKESKPTRHNRPTSPMAKLAMAISHPVRFRIITAMNAPERNASPKELAEEFDLDVKRVAYHVRELEALGYLELVETEPRRGSIEHVYRPVQRFEAWSLEWGELFPAFKQVVAASALGIGVAAIGASIDAGKFQARDDSVLAQDTFRTDERGAEEAGKILIKAVEELVAVANDATARLTETGEEGFLLSYLTASFEGALRPV